MDLLQYYIITLFVLVVTAVWLKHRGRERTRFAHALYALLAVQIVGIAVAYLALLSIPGQWLALALQIVAWAILLWGLGLDWRFSLGLLLMAIIATLLPFFPIQELLTWGFVMALPFASQLPTCANVAAFPFLRLPPWPKHCALLLQTAVSRPRWYLQSSQF
ncbi:MAG: hypothetical protein HC804_01885 [Anaerolineae bacterium]|nr:hypothetical protein [Anaerolineae bacterium]